MTITIEKEKMEKVLEALELSAVTVDSFGVQKKTQEAITAIKQALAAPVPLALWTEAQHKRAYRNSPELHKDVKSLAAFKRVAKEVAAMYGITEKGQP